MKSKLTLSISEEAIKKGKVYSKLNDISISEIVEQYLNSLLIDQIEKDKSTSFIGCLADTELSKLTNDELKEMYYLDKLNK